MSINSSRSRLRENFSGYVYGTTRLRGRSSGKQIRRSSRTICGGRYGSQIPHLMHPTPLMQASGINSPKIHKMLKLFTCRCTFRHGCKLFFSRIGLVWSLTQLTPSFFLHTDFYTTRQLVILTFLASLHTVSTSTQLPQPNGLNSHERLHNRTLALIQPNEHCQ